jgi:23S rRNA (guanine2445-N2)-methyltransferase / 23S rRNA (guanine2069-N7)-methyltransferase
LKLKLKLIAACAFGLEAILKRELIALGYPDVHVIQPGRVRFTGEFADICKTNLWLRTGDRVMIEILRFVADDFDALFETVKSFDWSQYLPPDAAFPVDAKTRKSKLTSLPAIQRTVKKAIVESLKAYHSTEALPETGPLFRIEVTLLEDSAAVAIDTTGPSLHKRGYRKLSASAPLKESLAAALIDLSVWNPERLLVDPFCGSGTIPIEAALIGLNLAPGLNREFSSSTWPRIPDSLWQQARDEARSSAALDRELSIIGTDLDPKAIELARFHSKQAGVESQIHFQQKRFQDLRNKRPFGCIVTNPPYGERLANQDAVRAIYESIPAVMQRLPTWSLFLITNFPNFEKTIGKKAERRRKLYNGRIECTYYQFLGPRPPRKNLQHGDKRLPIDSSPEDSQPVFQGIQAKDLEQAELFKNRLSKRARHLRRWPRRGITCFRLYEKDIPEIPLVVDRYGDFIHITEYERPHDRDLGRHAAWLEQMVKTAAATLDVPIQHVLLKQRPKNRQRSQYEKINTTGKRIKVQENGLTFLVNLSDYVDTGLFLDHRNTREMVRKEAAGKDFLNLFAYTGSFSVYAAAGKAASTTTVDLSKNYLEWAKANMAANDLVGSQHQFIASDVMAFLRTAAVELNECFDLAVVDPPTYSNSKRTEADWDIQKLHVEMFRLIHDVMRPNGVVYFSTNFRKFKLQTDLIQGFEIRDISKQTVPEDFRNKRIHQCFRMCKIP